MSDFIERHFADMLASFYGDGDNDFYDYLEEDVMWYGPLEGQMIRGREELKKALSAGKRSLRFQIENMHTKLFPLKADVLLIIARYRLITYYPNGKIINYDQHALIVIRRKRVRDEDIPWRCPLIHISDILYKDARDSSTYSLYLDEERKKQISRFLDERTDARKLVLPGESNSSYFIREDSIRYIEGGKGVRCYLHTTGDEITVNCLLKDVEAQLPAYYYRCHSSFIVNLRCVKKISGYKITLDDGEEIPVPVKRYAEVKQYIEEYMK